MLRRLCSTAARPVLSIIRHPHPLPSATTPFDDPLAKFAIVEHSGTQFKITNDDVIVSDRMEGVDIGQIIELNKVLLIGKKDVTYLGRPYVIGAKVMAVVEEQTKDKKVIAFKMRRRKNSKRTKGFRRQVTILRIQEIVYDSA